jgi:uncharacterized protein
MSEAHTQSPCELPSCYGDNKITLLARDPHWLFAYWEISNTKENTFFEEFGQTVWQKSVPALKVTNVSQNSSFFIRINDFSDNWYINVPDTNNLYIAEIGRRVAGEFFIHLASSNYAATPTDKSSRNTAACYIDYRSLRKGTLDLASRNIYGSVERIEEFEARIGLSSPELQNRRLGESLFGVSSAELFGIKLEEHLGISSAVLFTRS